MIIRGTTPTNIFTTDIDLQNATVYLTYAQYGNTVFEKTGNDLTIKTAEDDDGATICLVTTTLTQDDTLALKANLNVSVQIRAIFADGKAIASEIMNISVGDILKDGVIEYELTEDKQDTMVSTKEVIELCDRLLSQGRGKKKSLEFIKTKLTNTNGLACGFPRLL